MFFYIEKMLLSDLYLIWLNHQPFGIFFFLNNKLFNKYIP